MARAIPHDSLPSDCDVELFCTPALFRAGVHIGTPVDSDKLLDATKPQYILQERRYGKIQRLLQTFRAESKEKLGDRIQMLKQRLDGKNPETLRRKARHQFDDDCFELTLVMNVLHPEIPLSVLRPPQPKGCAACGKEGNLKSCGKCRLAKYCGETCQHAHWQQHKKDCNKYSASGKRSFKINL